MAKNPPEYKGVADELSPAICLVTLLVSIGPYVSAYYFYISILAFVLVIVGLESYMHFDRKFEQQNKEQRLSFHYEFKRRSRSPLKQTTSVGFKERDKKRTSRFCRKRFQSMKTNRDASIISPSIIECWCAVLVKLKIQSLTHIRLESIELEPNIKIWSFKL